MEGGEATIEIRSDPMDVNSEITEEITRQVQPFWIARFPVTVAQFQVFATACYEDGQWVGRINSPFSFGDSYPEPKLRARYPNQPADNVNWWDAGAFCAWLSEILRFEIRLPTEFEWQLAATGGISSNTFPWGPDWDPALEPWRANILRSELCRSTAVGIYPHGQSPAGAMDMAGNVWDWCLNTYDDPANTDLAGDSTRVVRGGAWISVEDRARTAFRTYRKPDVRNNHVGMRLSCSSPIFDH